MIYTQHKQQVQLVIQLIQIFDQQITKGRTKKTVAREKSMRRNIGKSVSNLDLKLLDVKFIAINDNQIYLTQALQSAKRAKKAQHLPSLLLSKDNNQAAPIIVVESAVANKWQKQTPKSLQYNRQTLQTSDYTADQSMLGNVNSQEMNAYVNTHNNNLVMSLLEPKGNSMQLQQGEVENQLQQVKELVKIRRSQQLSLHNASNNNILSQSQADIEQKELQKYRRKIQLIKKENQIIHNQISVLYRNKISQNKQQFKKVKSIESFKMETLKTQSQDKNPFALRKQVHRNNEQVLRINKTLENQRLKTSNNLSVSQSKLPLTQNNSLSPLISQKANFYENLSQNSPYKQELQEIHKKMITSNFHKNFQQYLNIANKRVPEFIKKLKN